MERNLIDYLPPIMQSYHEMREIMLPEQVEVEQLWNACDKVLNDQFVVDATENGVSRWESILKIYPKDTDTLEERKFKVITEINKQLPYTLRLLEQLLTTLCGKNGYRVQMLSNSYSITVKLGMGNVNNFDYVCRMLDRMLPCNIERTVTMFNRHSMLTEYTHGELAKFTHEQLREEVM